MKKKILLIVVLVLLVPQIVLAGFYVNDSKKLNYIGETGLFYCYMYEYDINFISTFGTFRTTSDWSAFAVLEPKTEARRLKIVASLEDKVRRNDLRTMGYPIQDNKLWAWAVYMIYYKQQNKLYLGDEYYLNKYREIIALTKSGLEESFKSDEDEIWEIKDLMDAYIHARYKEISANQNSVVR